MFDGAAAVGAGAHGDAVFGLVVQIHLGGFGQDLGDGVGAGEHLAAVGPVGVGAADAADLLDDGVEFDAGPEGQGDEPAGGLDLGGGAAAGLAHLGEDLAEAHFIFVDRDVELAAAGVDQFGDPQGAGGTGPGGDGGNFVLGLVGAEAQDLLIPAAVPVDGDALEAQLIGQEIDLADVFGGGGGGEIHRLGDGVVGVLLEGRLNADVPLGRDVVGRDKEAADVLGDFLEVPDGAGLGDAAHELAAVEALLAGHLFKIGVHLHQFGPVQDPADKGDAKQGLDAAGAAGNDADGAGGGHGGGGGVAHVAVAVVGVEDAAGEVGKVAPLFGQGGGGGLGLFLDKGHDVFGDLHRVGGIVGDAQMQQADRQSP